MVFKVVKNLNLIGAIKYFTKHNCNLFMEVRLKILKNLRDKIILISKKIGYILGLPTKNDTPSIFPEHL